MIRKTWPCVGDAVLLVSGPCGDGVIDRHLGQSLKEVRYQGGADAIPNCVQQMLGYQPG
ncbi:hypothetical protein PP362_24655 [Mycobacteroides abscessus]|nr:hypothetical protein [Mycobacteroides abscessus]